MKKSVIHALSIILCLALLLVIAACGVKGDAPADETPAGTPASGSPSTDVASPAAEEFDSYSIGFTNLCSGIWILDYYQQNVENYLNPNGLEVMSLSANFSGDQMLKDIQNMIQAGSKGVLILPFQPTMMPSVSEMCEDGEVYFAGYSQLIMGDTLDMMNENPYYCGSIGMNAYMSGKQIGEMAIADGKAKAVIVAGNIGNTNHDNLIAGFTEVFEAGGGEILGVGHSETEAAQRADDLIAAYGSEIDCAFGMSMDFADSLIRACENYGLTPGQDVMVYAAELDGQGVEYVNEGKLKGLSQNAVDGSFSAAMVINAIDGHMLLDENGEAIWADNLLLFEVNQTNADNYQKYWIDGFPLPNESFDSLLYRCNPDITYDGFMDFINQYNYDFVMSLRSE